MTVWQVGRVGQDRRVGRTVLVLRRPARPARPALLEVELRADLDKPCLQDQVRHLPDGLSAGHRRTPCPVIGATLNRLKISRLIWAWPARRSSTPETTWRNWPPFPSPGSMDGASVEAEGSAGRPHSGGTVRTGLDVPPGRSQCLAARQSSAGCRPRLSRSASEHAVPLRHWLGMVVKKNGLKFWL